MGKLAVSDIREEERETEGRLLLKNQHRWKKMDWRELSLHSSLILIFMYKKFSDLA